jgi:hypothetical protein
VNKHHDFSQRPISSTANSGWPPKVSNIHMQAQLLRPKRQTQEELDLYAQKWHQADLRRKRQKTALANAIAALLILGTCAFVAWMWL